MLTLQTDRVQSEKQDDVLNGSNKSQVYNYVP